MKALRPVHPGQTFHLRLHREARPYKAHQKERSTLTKDSLCFKARGADCRKSLLRIEDEFGSPVASISRADGILLHCYILFIN